MSQMALSLIGLYSMSEPKDDGLLYSKGRMSRLDYLVYAKRRSG